LKVTWIGDYWLEKRIAVTGPLYEKSGLMVTVVFPIILMFSFEYESKVQDSSK